MPVRKARRKLVNSDKRYLGSSKNQLIVIAKIHPSPNRRVSAIEQLSAKHGKEANELFIRSLSDPNLLVRKAAVKALKKHGTKQAVPYLDKIIAQGKGAIVSEARKARIRAVRKTR